MMFLQEVALVRPTNGWDVLRDVIQFMGPVLSMIFTGLAAYFLQRLKAGQEKAVGAAIDAATTVASATEQVKTSLAISNRNIDKKLDEITVKVDGQLTGTQDQVRRLTLQLEKAGIVAKPQGDAGETIRTTAAPHIPMEEPKAKPDA